MMRELDRYVYFLMRQVQREYKKRGYGENGDKGILSKDIRICYWST